MADYARIKTVARQARKCRLDMARIDKESREKLIGRVRQLVASSEKLSKATASIDIKDNQVYLNQRCLPLDPDGRSAKALIEGQVITKIFARITVHDTNASRCKLEWPGPEKKWTILTEGTLEGCLDFLSKETYFNEGMCI